MDGEDTLRADLFSMPVEVVKIERRKQNTDGDDVVIDFQVQLEYSLGMGKFQTINVFMDKVPSGLQVGGTDFYLVLEARS